MAKSKTLKVESFTNTNVKEILAECEAALKAVADKYGLDLQRKNCRYRTDELPMSFYLAPRGANGESADDLRLTSDFVQYATMFGLKPSWIGHGFTLAGDQEYTIVGLRPKARRMPVVAQKKSDGKRYVFPAEVIAAAMQPNEDAKAAPGTKVTWKHEYEDRRGAAGPAWLQDPAQPEAEIRLDDKDGQIVRVPVADTSAVVSTDADGRNIGWITKRAAQMYARTIGATFVEV